jgi:hypothetical protein
MAILSHVPDARGQWSEAGRLMRAGFAWTLFAIGWLLAKSLRLVATAIAAVLFAAGYLAGRVVWPSLVWCGRAVRLGWEQGRKPGFRAG